MANLTRIEDIISGAALYQFEANPKVSSLDQSWQRRSGTYQVVGMDYGVNPFGSFAAPISPRKLSWTFRVLVKADANRQANLDLAHDAIARACAKKRTHLLVQSSGGKERVTRAQVTDFSDVTTSADHYRHRDFTVAWEMLAPWRDRLIRGPHTIGDTVGVLMGATPLLMGAGSIPLTLITVGGQQLYSPFTILADGSDGLPAPTVDDTGPGITVYGPLGGDGGFRLICYAQGAQLRDTNNTITPTYLDVAHKIPTGNATDAVNINCGALGIATGGGTDLWTALTVPDWQPWWQMVSAGEQNGYQIVPLGANPVVGATTRVIFSWTGLYQ